MLTSSGLPARLLLPAALAALVLLLLLGGSRPARALAEGDVSFTVTQSPAAPATVQVGSEVTFTVTANVAVSPGVPPLLFELTYPAALLFVEGFSDPPSVTCVDNTPIAGTVRCSYGPVSDGDLVVLTLRFTITADATTSAANAVMRAGPSDGAPDSAADGNDAFVGAGTLTVFAASMFTAAGSASPPATFERASLTYTATLLNNSGTATGPFTATVDLPNAIVQGVTCSSGTGSYAGSQAVCTDATLADGETLTITTTLRPENTASGDDIAPVISAPALGISGVTLPAITVHEVGLQRTSGAPAVDSPITVCTAAVPTDDPDTAAAGAAQPANAALMVGAPSAQPLLQLGDFIVSGPGDGTVSPASGCGANQSGVTFTPSAPGTYTITAKYNVGGTNDLAIEVPGAPNPLPVLTSISPSSAVAGSGPVTVALTGSGFVAASEVRWNGTPLASVTFNSSTSLTAVVPAANLTAPGTFSVTVFNPAPGGGTSAPQTFTVTAAASKLAFTTQPGNGVAGQPLAVQPIVAVQTDAGATVTSDNTTVVTLAVSGGAALTCTGGLSKTVAAGVAAFSGCAVTPAGTGYILTATASPPLTPATSAPFDVTAAPPTATPQLTFPAVAGPVPRSRLAFRVESGTLAPTQVRLVIRRASDGKYWNATSAAWQNDPVQNVMTAAGSARWELPITGIDRRAFRDTAVTIEAFATAGGTEYRSAATANLSVR
ncbi:IPT/TIG domain-containing protein [Tepidiforma thermophila]|uniref:IPT/TIG domain-containing protein n=1 Tax=Tepidiforma thermophila (strain KCTC 52669 / CGMCC 1.13589 / G233) TaxID=2761530 RepID=A0A2A9HG87_TEPT2|nr:IPT/TIG domain-containing protein [Tepidiforma thermophila]PFG73986.1 IPT/TIG domain-containing protein [Tepidiforma thermophila]